MAWPLFGVMCMKYIVYLKRNVISLRRHLLSSFYNTCNNVLRPVVLFSKSILRHYMTCCHWQRPRTESLSTNDITFMFSNEIFNECKTTNTKFDIIKHNLTNNITSTQTKS